VGAKYDHVTLNGHTLRIKWDQLTHSPRIVKAEDIALLRVENISALSGKEIAKVGGLLLAKLGHLFRIAPEQLKLKAAEKISGTWYVSYWQTFKGLVIYQSSLGFYIDPEGAVTSVGAVLYPQVEIPDSAKISRKKALEIAKRQIDDFHKLAYQLLAESILVYSDRKSLPIHYYRVYAFNFFPSKATDPASVVGGWAVFVDSQTGKVVLKEILFKPLGCCLPEPGE
jgi:Zn-dependent metalloprotease